MLQISNLTYSINSKIVLSGVNLALGAHDRLALIGDNGTGKTTLLKLITGELKPDFGTITNKGFVAYVPQHTEDDALSGGQVTQREIKRAIYQPNAPSLLLLDEPTNNLDTKAREWLEQVVQCFDGPVILASHDRAFMDKVATHVAEIKDGKLEVFKGGYSAYSVVQEWRQAEQQAEYDKQQTAKNKLLTQLHAAKNTANRANHARYDKTKVADMKMSFNSRVDNAKATAGKQVHAAASKLDQLSDIEKPRERKTYGAYLSSDIKHDKNLVLVQNVTKSFGEHQVLGGVSFSINTGGRVHVVGGNGSGKSTLLKIVAGLVKPDSGVVKLADGLKFGYVSQSVTGIDAHCTGLDNLLKDTPDKAAIYQAASTMDITPADLDKPASQLSRGQITKLAIMRLLFQSLDLIILDEPTNHIDIRARENIEGALSGYQGALLLASHDQYFVKQLGITDTMNILLG
ncbi:MAG: ATP-binding cassette domain-containing protein [Candidatus Nomurabacteria bacterium]|nr:ATP-binding cassette domain-containing protein [Candidatus Nomurabacteria bacterium]